MGYFRFSFYTDRTFYRPVRLYPTICIKKNKNFTKNPLNFYLLKVKTFHSDSVKNESVREKRLFRVKVYYIGDKKREKRKVYGKELIMEI